MEGIHAICGDIASCSPWLGLVVPRVATVSGSIVGAAKEAAAHGDSLRAEGLATGARVKLWYVAMSWFCVLSGFAGGGRGPHGQCIEFGTAINLQLYLLVRVWSLPVSRLCEMEPGRSSRRRISICPGNKAAERARVVRLIELCGGGGRCRVGLSGLLGLGLGRGATQVVGHVAIHNAQGSDDCQLMQWG